MRLIRGDCLEVLPTLGGASVDVILTDPPYGITYQSNHRLGRGSQPITNDGTRLSLRLYRKVVPLLKADHVLWFTRWDAWPDVWEILGQSYPLKGMLVWDKGHLGMGDLSHWGCSHELIASAGCGKTTGTRDGSILRFAPVPSARRVHPAEKPVELMAYLIDKIVPPGGAVLDPFMGSGTVGVACVRTGRDFIGIESDEAFFAVAQRRIAEAEGCRDGTAGELFAPLRRE